MGAIGTAEVVVRFFLRPLLAAWLGHLRSGLGTILKSAVNWSLRGGGFSTKYAPRFQGQVSRHGPFLAKLWLPPRIGQG